MNGDVTLNLYGEDWAMSTLRSPLRGLNANVTPVKSPRSKTPTKSSRKTPSKIEKTPPKDGRNLIKGFYNSPDDSVTKKASTGTANKSPIRGGGRSGHYKVVFPKGSMGLELEPVIVSTARKIGCRGTHPPYPSETPQPRP